MGVKKVLVGVAVVALVGGVSGGAYAYVTHDERAFADEYAGYEKAYSQVEKKVNDLAPINEGCVVDMNDETLNPLCEDLDTALKAVPEKVKVDVDKVARDDAQAKLAEVTKARKALDAATANVDKAYEVAEPKLEAAREVFVAEVDKVIEETKTFIKDAQVIIDAAKEVGVDSSELETAKTNAEKTVATLEGDRDTMRRSTHTETVTELNIEKETVDVLAAATLVVVADKNEAVAEKAVATIGNTERINVEKAVEKVVEADQSGKLTTITTNNNAGKSGSSVTSAAVSTPKAQATAQTKTNTNSGSSGTYNNRTNHNQTTTTQNGGKIHYDAYGYTDPQGKTHFQVDLDYKALQDIDDEWIGVSGDGDDSFFYTTN